MPWSFYDKNGNLKQAAANVVRPMARVTQTSAQSVTNGVQTAITFSGVGSADFDTYASVSPMWASGNPGRLTAPITGRYRLTASVSYVATGAQFNQAIEFRKNGATALSGTTEGWTTSGDGGNNAATFSIIVALNAGDYIEILSFQQGGAARNTVPSATWLAMEYLDGAVAVPVAYPASLVGQEVAYAEQTANVASTASTEGTAATVVSASATTDGTSKYRIEYGFPAYTNGNNTATDLIVILHDGTNPLGRVFVDNNAASSATLRGNYGSREYVPAAGTRTYSLRFYNAQGNNVTVIAGAGGAGAYMPAFIRVVKAS